MPRLSGLGRRRVCADSLLGLPPHDWDLCTDALSEEMVRIFSDFSLVRIGERHGTIAVVLEGRPVEVTTFRTEGGYEDHRRPDWVHFEKISGQICPGAILPSMPWPTVPAGIGPIPLAGKPISGPGFFGLWRTGPAV